MLNTKKKNVREKSDSASVKYDDETRKLVAFVSYISKLLMPLCAISAFFINDTEKPWCFWIILIFSLIGFSASAAVNILYPLVANPNEKADADDIDAIGGSLVISTVTPGIILFMCVSVISGHWLNNLLILGIPATVITVICYLMNAPVTESEKASRVFVVAGTVIFCIMLINSVHYTNIAAEYGRVKYVDTDGKGSSDAMVVSDSGEEELYDIHFFEDSIDEGDRVIIESKKGLLGIKTEEIKQNL